MPGIVVWDGGSSPSGLLAGNQSHHANAVWKFKFLYLFQVISRRQEGIAVWRVQELPGPPEHSSQHRYRPPAVSISQPAAWRSRSSCPHPEPSQGSMRGCSRLQECPEQRPISLPSLSQHAAGLPPTVHRWASRTLALLPSAFSTLAKASPLRLWFPFSVSFEGWSYLPRNNTGPLRAGPRFSQPLAHAQLSIHHTGRN